MEKKKEIQIQKLPLMGLPHHIGHFKTGGLSKKQKWQYRKAKIRGKFLLPSEIDVRKN